MFSVNKMVCRISASAERAVVLRLLIEGILYSNDAV